MTEIDHILQVGVEVSKQYTILDDQATPQPIDLSGFPVLMRVYLDPPVDLLGTVSGADDNIVTFLLDSSVNSVAKLYEYRVITSDADTTEIELVKGNIYYLPVEGFTTQIPTLIANESLGLTIPINFQTQSILYWKYYLAPALNLLLPEQIEDEAYWPMLYKFLIAKLVVHDFLVQQMKLSLSNGFTISGSGVTASASSGSLKSLQEGPSKAEFYDVNSILTELLKKNSNGSSSFDELRSDICTLAQRLTIWLPLCPRDPNLPILPLKGGNCKCIDIPCWTRTIERG